MEMQRVQKEREWKGNYAQVEEEKRKLQAEDNRIQEEKKRIEEEKRVMIQRMQQVDMLVQEAKRDREYIVVEKQVYSLLK